MGQRTWTRRKTLQNALGARGCSAVNEVVLREGLMDQLRAMLRLQDPERIAKLTEGNKLPKLIDEVRQSTVRCALAIQKWIACFVHPRPFLFDGADYLQHMAASLDFLTTRPGLSAVFSGPAPLGHLREPSMLEQETLDTLRDHLRIFGSLSRKETCAWCGSLGARDGLVPCTDQNCERSRYCRPCIEINAGGSRAYKLAKVEKSWRCFYCTACELEARKRKRQDAQAHARAIQRRKKDEARAAAAAAKLERERAPENVRRRRVAARCLADRVLEAQQTLREQQFALKDLARIARASRRTFQARKSALAWTKGRGQDARAEVVQLERLLEMRIEQSQVSRATSAQEASRAQEEQSNFASGDETNTAAAIAASDISSAENSTATTKNGQGALPDSLDLHEQDHADRRRAEQDARADANRSAEAEWLKLGVPVRLRFALRVLHFEVCLISVASTTKNPEIVQVRTFVPSEQRFVEPPMLMHKSQVVHDVRPGPLLRTLRTKAHVNYTAKASDWLLQRAKAAQHTLAHNQRQYHLRQELCELADAAKTHQLMRAGCGGILLRKRSRIENCASACRKCRITLSTLAKTTSSSVVARLTFLTIYKPSSLHAMSFKSLRALHPANDRATSPKTPLPTPKGKTSNFEKPAVVSRVKWLDHRRQAYTN
ncbi:Hypothetical Protein FCC1311_037362 [Hondaea fermentalgiana]|uniref:Uncharacterized protein n=1 Tax=Hondaea fermentalgiana TaxID=2315210 RepID=A0A2R5GFU8_9STRA|nr:Hypothetical Protein FCC1311_037362 [Hondaea fermentalgiana]|eukprot:GBG27513.1 Hypothetical Protein FCC1311_037362 [Hondaea fermentalgiana]